MKNNTHHQSNKPTVALKKNILESTEKNNSLTPPIETKTCEISSHVNHQNTICAGQHFIIDFWGAEHLQDIDMIDQALRSAAEAAGAVLLHIHLHQFSGAGGITGVALLAESHISIHTWPENNYAAFDIFMCGSAQPEKSVKILKDVFKPTKVDQSLLLRGQLQCVENPNE